MSPIAFGLERGKKEAQDFLQMGIGSGYVLSFLLVGIKGTPVT